MATHGNIAVIEGKQVQAITILDDEGFPLIAEKDLPFIDQTAEYHNRIKWSPPTGYFDGLHYGMECALALLRLAPKWAGRSRSDEISFYGAELLDQQNKRAGSGKSGAYWARWQFWETMLHFTAQPATARNVAHYLNERRIGYLKLEVSALRETIKRGRRAKQSRSRRKAVRS